MRRLLRTVNEAVIHHNPAAVDKLAEAFSDEGMIQEGVFLKKWWPVDIKPTHLWFCLYTPNRDTQRFSYFSPSEQWGVDVLALIAETKGVMTYFMTSGLIHHINPFYLEYQGGWRPKETDVMPLTTPEAARLLGMHDHDDILRWALAQERKHDEQRDSRVNR